MQAAWEKEKEGGEKNGLVGRREGAEGKGEGGKRKALTSGARLSSQPWASWVPPLSFFSQGSCANNLNYRRTYRHVAREWWVLSIEVVHFLK